MNLKQLMRLHVVTDSGDIGELTPENIQKAVRSGKTRKYFHIGDEINIPWVYLNNGTETTIQYPFVVAHIGDAVDPNEVTHHDALYLMGKYATHYNERVNFDTSEKTVATAGETVLEGWHYYAKNGNLYEEYTFTPGDTIPSDQEYCKHIKVDADACIRNGSGRYKESAIRQWLNSTASAGNWWTAQHLSDVAPAKLTYFRGFLAGFSSDWLNVFMPVRIKTYYNTKSDGTGWDTVYDKCFAPSKKEVYGIAGPVRADEGVPWEYWKDIAGIESPTDNNTETRKMRTVDDQSGTSRQAYLRSANANLAEMIGSNGNISQSNALNAYATIPCFVIY